MAAVRVVPVEIHAVSHTLLFTVSTQTGTKWLRCLRPTTA